MRGAVKFFNTVKGWGFLRPAWSDGNPGADVFVHHSAIERRPGEVRAQLLDGEAVEFEMGEDRRRRQCAVNVRRLGAAQPVPGPDTPGVVRSARAAEAPGAPRTGQAADG